MSEQEVDDPRRLEEEASAYADRFLVEEDDRIGRFDIGVSNYTTNRALVYTIEAARLLCGGANERAIKLLKMAAAEIESATA